MKYGDLISRALLTKLSSHVFVRDGVDKSIFDFIESSRPMYEYVESQLKKFTDIYCLPQDAETGRFEYKSDTDKEKFVASVRKLMDSEIEEAHPKLNLRRTDISDGEFFRASDPRTWLSAADMAMVFKYIDAQKEESCE